MNKDTEEFNTENSPHCPNYDCPYIVFLANEDDNGDYYCMECDELFYENEVE